MEKKKIFKFYANDQMQETAHIYKADNKQEASYLFLEECLGIKLSTFQIEDVLKNLVVGNPIFDLILCDEVLP